MAVDAPAKIAILGAGPIGLEVGIYARFLGYEVDIFERGKVADHVISWGHVRMFSPFRMNCSSLGIAAITTQNPDYARPGDDAILTGNEWVTSYLLPLAKTDLLADSIQEGMEVVAIGREGVNKMDFVGQPQRAEIPFRILLRDSEGTERAATADIVIDTTGVYATPNPLGSGGLPAIGETVTSELIDYRIPDIIGDDREKFVGQNILLVGSGYSAATTVVALSELTATDSATKTTWVTRRDEPGSSNGPIRTIENDPLSERATLADRANLLASSERQGVVQLARTNVHAIRWDDVQEQFVVQLSGRHAGEYQFDRVISHVGFRPDNRIYQELQVHEGYATSGPMKLAALLMGQESGDCLQLKGGDAQTLCHPEPNFYILGSKSFGRRSNFLYSMGLEQIQQLFTLIGDRRDLDLYSSVGHLNR